MTRSSPDRKWPSSVDVVTEFRDAAALSAVVFAVAALLRLTSPGRGGRSLATAKRHARYQAAADRALARLDEIGPMANPERAFGYLRSVPPYVFEEMILSEIEARGHGVKRGPRYSGDGGIDGFFEVHGRRWYVQAKRYRQWVRPADVAAFGAICEAQGARGLFVHTGKTGPASKVAERASPFVRVISGLDLVRLFAGEKLPLFRG